MITIGVIAKNQKGDIFDLLKVKITNEPALVIINKQLNNILPVGKHTSLHVDGKYHWTSDKRKDEFHYDLPKYLPIEKSSSYFQIIESHNFAPQSLKPRKKSFKPKDFDEVIEIKAEQYEENYWGIVPVLFGKNGSERLARNFLHFREKEIFTFEDSELILALVIYKSNPE